MTGNADANGLQLCAFGRLRRMPRNALANLVSHCHHRFRFDVGQQNDERFTTGSDLPFGSRLAFLELVRH